MYPSREQERNLRLGPTPNINDFADALLTAVFDHARQMREESEGFLRSIVFSSLNPDICTALNWKQPNCESSRNFPYVHLNRSGRTNHDLSLDPVLLCNELGVDIDTASPEQLSAAKTALSVKEAVQIAKDNNFMGLISSFELMVRGISCPFLSVYQSLFHKPVRKILARNPLKMPGIYRPLSPVENDKLIQTPSLP
jgi:CDK inhibitor PHO81